MHSIGWYLQSKRAAILQNNIIFAGGLANIRNLNQFCPNIIDYSLNSRYLAIIGAQKLIQSKSYLDSRITKMEYRDGILAKKSTIGEKSS